MTDSNKKLVIDPKTVAHRATPLAVSGTGPLADIQAAASAIHNAFDIAPADIAAIAVRDTFAISAAEAAIAIRDAFVIGAKHPAAIAIRDGFLIAPAQTAIAIRDSFSKDPQAAIAVREAFVIGLTDAAAIAVRDTLVTRRD